MAELKNDISKKILLDAIELFKFRTEKQEEGFNNVESFVPIVDFSSLSTANTQIIFGRNGTGKTHLLKAFYQYCETNFEKNKVLAAYIDFKDLDLGSALQPISPTDLVLRFYQGFLYKVIDRLDEFSDEVITVGFLEKVFGGNSADRKKRINTSISNLKSLLDRKQIEESLEKYSKEITLNTEGSSRVGGQANIKGVLSPSKLSAELETNLGISSENIEKEKETIGLVYKGLAVIKYEIIREELEAIIHQCGARAIIILVDEWSSVDVTIQPLLAEMIRKTLAISNKIFLKIAALKYFTKTSVTDGSRQRIGWQTGIDITPLVDLDSLLNYDANEQGIKDFLTLVAYEHTCLELPALKKHSVKEFEQYLCSELFENFDTYAETVRASEGNPRDFLNILTSCCSTAKLSDDKKLSIAQVTRISLEYFTSNKFPEIINIPGGDNLYQSIFRKVVQTGSKIFMFSRQKAESNETVKELWHYRFIHIVNPSFAITDSQNIPHEYILYSMDYGKLLSLKVNKAGETLINSMREYPVQVQEEIYPSLSKPVLSRLVKSPVVGGKLKEIQSRLIKDIGARSVSKMGGVESAKLHDVDYLIKNCVLDDLLS